MRQVDAAIIWRALQEQGGVRRLVSCIWVTLHKEYIMRFVATICRASLAVVGGLMVFSAMGSTAWAVDIGPEIDPTSIASAVTLFMGSAMLLTAKRRK